MLDWPTAAVIISVISGIVALVMRYIAPKPNGNGKHETSHSHDVSHSKIVLEVTAIIQKEVTRIFEFFTPQLAQNSARAEALGAQIAIAEAGMKKTEVQWGRDMERLEDRFEKLEASFDKLRESIQGRRIIERE